MGIINYMFSYTRSTLKNKSRLISKNFYQCTIQIHKQTRKFPKQILNDNGTQFQLATKTIKYLQQQEKQKTEKEIKEFLEEKKIEWKFVTEL